MSKDWNYAKLTETVSQNGGPEKWLASIKDASYKQGATDMKNKIVIPLLVAGVTLGVAGVKATEYIIHWVQEKKEKKIITEKEAIKAEQYLLSELETSITDIEAQSSK